ncbi:MAG: DUF2255 family protein [Solirubrobacterales bacterium]|nr:DUF2255 family protein [Solirubrobacterales bacterium]
MAAWTETELRRIDQADELEISPVRRSGELRARRPIWVVRVGDDLYVRAAYGSGSGWYRVARTSGQARIWAGDVMKDVNVEDGDDSVLDQIDAAYRKKYGRYASIVGSITDAEHRAMTLRLVPRGEA